nr:hypothetical protein [Candidatus Gracilibacteria bacterium]
MVNQIEQLKSVDHEKTIKELVKELNLANFKLPDGLDDGDIIKLTEDELKKLREDINSTDKNEQALIFKKFLEGKIDAIRSESQEGIDRLKKLVENTQNSLKNIPQVGVPLTVAEATNKLKPIQETLSAVKEGVQELLTPLFKLLSSIPLIGGLFKWLGEFFGLDLGKNLTDKAEKLSEEGRDKLKQNIKPLLEKLAGKGGFIPEVFSKNPIIKGNIEKALKDESIFSQDALNELEKRQKENGKISFEDLRYILGGNNGEKFKKLKEIILDKEGQEALYLQGEKDMVDAIQKRYNVNLSKEKREELTKMIKEERSNISFDALLEKYMDGKVVDGFDVIGSMFGTGISLFWFSTKLIGKGIISVSDLFIKFAESGLKMIKFMTPFGVGTATLQEFKDELKGKSEKERLITLGLLYRESGLFFDIISGALGMSSRLALETVRPGASSYKAFWDSQMSNFEEQIKYFQEIEKSCIGEFSDETSQALNGVKLRLNSLAKYHEVAMILEEVEHGTGNLQQAKDRILKLGIQAKGFEKGILDAKNFEGLRAHLKSNLPEFGEIRLAFEGKTGFVLKDKVASSLYAGKARALEGIIKNTEDSLSYIKLRISGGEHWYQFLNVARGHEKILADIANFNIGRNVEKLAIEGSPKEQLTKIQALNKLAQDAPEFFRTLFPGITGVTCIGLNFATAEEGQSFTTTAIDSILLMSRVIGPASLFLKAGTMRDPETGNVEWVNIAQSGVGAVLLGFDTVGLIKEVKSSKGFIDLLSRTGKYTIRPITDIGKFGLETYKMGVNIKDVIKSKGSVTEALKVARGVASKGSKEAGIIGKSILKTTPGKIALGIGLAGLAGGVYAYEKFTSFESDFEKLEKDGIIDKDWNLIIGKEKEAKKWFSELSDSKKARFAELIFSTKQSFIESAGNINFEYQNGNIVATSSNPLIGDWIFLDPRIESYLKSFGFEGKIEFSPTKKANS